MRAQRSFVFGLGHQFRKAGLRAVISGTFRGRV